MLRCGLIAMCCAMAALTMLENTAAQEMDNTDVRYLRSDDSESAALRSLLALLSTTGTGSGEHVLARKSVRSPSRRLRFGRRSDPEMPTHLELGSSEDELEREYRMPVRLRFGRRSDENAVPHFFPSEIAQNLYSERPRRVPSMRLRFGKRSVTDNDMLYIPSMLAEQAPKVANSPASSDELDHQD